MLLIAIQFLYYNCNIGILFIASCKVIAFSTIAIASFTFRYCEKYRKAKQKRIYYETRGSTFAIEKLTEQ